MRRALTDLSVINVPEPKNIFSLNLAELCFSRTVYNCFKQSWQQEQQLLGHGDGQVFKARITRNIGKPKLDSVLPDG